MQTGDVVVCVGSRGYCLTTGKEYTVLDYQPAWYDSSAAAGFKWPAYVIVEDDFGVRVHCHASRFKPKD